jgi:hypothetical protein
MDDYEHPTTRKLRLGKGPLEMEKPPRDSRDPDHTRKGIFVYHNCWRCKHGLNPCVQGNPHKCENPHARND